MAATPKKRSPRISEDSRLLANPRKRLRVFVNKNGEEGTKSLPVVGNSIDTILGDATVKLALTRPGRKLYNEEGKQVDWKDLEPDMMVWVSGGEGFRKKGYKAKQADPSALTEKLYGKQPAMLRVFKNGETQHDVKICSGPIGRFLSNATSKLQLTAPARKVFNEEGTQLSDQELQDLPRDTAVYVSCGRGFKRPGAETKTTSSPTSRSFGATYNTPVAEAYRNGEAQYAVSVVVRGTFDQFLSACTGKLNLPKAARKIFSEDGQVVEDHTKIERGQKIYVSCGEPFLSGDPDAPSRIKEVHLSARLQHQARPTFQAVRNGDAAHHATVVAPVTFEQMLSLLTVKLNMPMACRRIFTGEGVEVPDLATLNSIERGSRLVASAGEPFRDPEAKVVRGEAPNLSSLLSPRMREDQESAARAHVRVLLNGHGAEADGGRVVVATTYDQLLQEATVKLRPACGRVLFFFSERGEKIPEDILVLERGQVLYAATSKGEAFVGYEQTKKKKKKSSPRKD